MKAKTRDDAIIEFVHRYGLGLYVVLKSRFFAHATMNAVIHVVGRLCKQDALTSHPLLDTTKYVRLGPSAVRRRPDYRMSETKKLPPSRVPIELGALLFCMEKEQHRLTPSEVKTLYPRFPEQLIWKHPYYIDTDGDLQRLAMIRVELSESPHGILKKHKRSIYRCNHEYPGFRSLFDKKELMLVVISPSEHVLSALADLLAHELWYPPCRLFHCPDLLHFLP